MCGPFLSFSNLKSDSGLVALMAKKTFFPLEISLRTVFSRRWWSILSGDMMRESMLYRYVNEIGI